MARIFLAAPAIVRLSKAEAQASSLNVEYSLSSGWNTVPDALLDHWYVKNLVRAGKSPVIPDDAPDIETKDSSDDSDQNDPPTIDDKRGGSKKRNK